MANYSDAIYFIQDQVSEEVTSFGFGEAWLYFYKETMIGVRDARNKVSYFTTLPLPAGENLSPTAKKLNEGHIEDAISEMSTVNETCHRVDMIAMAKMAKDIIRAELSL